MTDIAHRDLDIAQHDLDIALAILAEHAPQCEARAFGSRADGTAREFSDIDIALVGAAPLGRDALGVVREAFQESDMRIRADVIDWHTLSDSFKEIVSRNYIVIQRPAQAPAGAPAGWRETTIGECAIISNETYSPKEDWQFVNYLDTGNITDNRVSEIQRLTAGEDKIPSRARRKVRDGDIVYSTVRPNQRHYGIIKNPPDNFLASTGFAVMRGMPDIADTGFIYSFLTQSHIVDHLHGLAEQNVSAYPSIRPQDIAELELRLPPLPEQRRIAGILGALDDKIALNRRMNATLEGMAQALFRHWFVDYEPVRAKMSGRWRRGESLAGMLAELWDAFPARLAPTALGEAPAGWGVRALGDELAELVSGQRPRGGAVKLGVPSVGAENVLGLGKYNFGSEKYVPEDFYAKLQSRGADIRNGDVLLYKDGAQLGRKTYFDCDFPHPDCAVNEHAFILRLRNPAAQRYLYFWLDQPWMTREIAELNSNSAQPGINRAGVRGLPLLMPSDEVLAAFDEIASALTNRIFAACHSSRDLAALRDALLPQLLSGKLRAL